jgi:hypothetical protein
VLAAVAAAAIGSSFFHETRAEADGSCVACCLALTTVAVHATGFTWSIQAVALGTVPTERPSPGPVADLRASASRGPPLA